MSPIGREAAETVLAIQHTLSRHCGYLPTKWSRGRWSGCCAHRHLQWLHTSKEQHPRPAPTAPVSVSPLYSPQTLYLTRNVYSKTPTSLRLFPSTYLKFLFLLLWERGSIRTRYEKRECLRKTFRQNSGKIIFLVKEHCWRR